MTYTEQYSIQQNCLDKKNAPALVEECQPTLLCVGGFFYTHLGNNISEYSTEGKV